MKSEQFQKPQHFQPVFSVSLEKPLELWAGYSAMCLFLLGALATLFKGDYVGAVICLLCVAFLNLIVSHLEKHIENPLIMEVSKEGIHFPHWNLYLPFNCVKSVSEKIESGYVPGIGAVTANSLNVFFELNQEQLMYLRKVMIKRFSWPQKIASQNDSILVSMSIPFTRGRGKPLSASKEEIADNLNKMLSDYKG